MKKILFLTIGVIALCGCSKEKDDEIIDSLSGTVWVNKHVWEDGPVTATLRFTSNKNVTIEMNPNDGLVTASIKCTYVYNPPTIIIFFPFEELEEEEEEFISMTLKGNTIEYIYDDEIHIFKKK
jgi:hypothetical protein